jgi:TolB protein
VKREFVILTATTVALAFAGSAVARFGLEFDSRIAFVQDRDIFSMNPDGNDVRQLTNVGASVAFWENWSPDGRQLVFTEFPNGAPKGQLWLMNADGSHQHLLLSEADFDEEDASFSPDGAWIVFSRCPTTPTGNGCAIYKLLADGSDLTQVTDFKPDVTDFAPAYSPDGAIIAYESFGYQGFTAAIWLVDADGSDPRPLSPPELLGNDPSWSPGGEEVAFWSHCCGHQQNGDIWVINRDGSGLRRLTGSKASDFEIPVAYYNIAPSWSPHGLSIVFDQYVTSTNTDTISIINADGTGRKLIRQFTAPQPRIYARSSTESKNRSRHRTPREIESGGRLPRWSPELQ